MIKGRYSSESCFYSLLSDEKMILNRIQAKIDQLNNHWI